MAQTNLMLVRKEDLMEIFAQATAPSVGVYDKKAAMDFLSVKKEVFDMLEDNGEFEVIRVGCRKRYTVKGLNDYLKRHTVRSKRVRQQEDDVKRALIDSL